MIESNTLIIKHILQKIGRGHFITLKDFGTYVSYESLRSELVNLAKNKTLFHIANGVYYFPEIFEAKKKKPCLIDYLIWLDSNGNKLNPDLASAKKIIELEENKIDTLVFSSNAPLKRTKFLGRLPITIKTTKKDVPLNNFSFHIRILNILLKYGNIEIHLCRNFATKYCINEIKDNINNLPPYFNKLIL